MTARGYSLLDCLFAVTLVGIIAAASMPPLTAALERSRSHAAARFIYGQMMLARARAVARGAVVALQISGTPDGAVLRTFVDGNRNGVRAADIGAGVDIGDGASIAFRAAFRGVRVEPVEAAGVLFSFTPLGTSSSGTFYVTGRDGSRFAVRVLGTTGRARILRHLPASDEWTDAE